MTGIIRAAVVTNAGQVRHIITGRQTTGDGGTVAKGLGIARGQGSNGTPLDHAARTASREPRNYLEWLQIGLTLNVRSPRGRTGFDGSEEALVACPSAWRRRKYLRDV